MTDFDKLAAALRAGAADSNPHERAAVALLIWHEGWLRRRDFLAAAVITGNGTAFIRWEPARQYADRVLAGGLDAPRASTSEAHVLDLAVALGEDRFGVAGFGHVHRLAAAQVFAAACGVHIDGPAA